MKTNTSTTTKTEREYTEELYNQAEKAVYIALRARHEKSGLQFLAELQNGQATDRQARANTDTAEQITKLEEKHNELTARLEELRKDRATADRKAKSIKTAEQDRKAFARLSAQIKAQEQPLTNRIKSINDDLTLLYNSLEITFTDRADLTQTAILELLKVAQTPQPITATVLASYGATTEEELTEEQRATAQESANFRAVINAVGKAINNLATPEANNRYTTKAEKITDLNEVTDFILKYGGIGKDYKAPHQSKRARTSDCYITIEERDTKTQKGFYRITHYRTIAPYQYIEDFTTDGEENDVEYLKTYNPFVSNSADLESLEELFKKANLTPNERLIAEGFAKACRVEGDFKKAKALALTHAKIKTAEARKRAWSRFIDHLKKATEQ